ncbi:Uncharacterised protein [Candidatus Tiddalikarchaeum anstoanum]|nr:Uncharacterised protein [Candidatus Tiddalikarchaeum anstoanum]
MKVPNLDTDAFDAINEPNKVLQKIKFFEHSELFKHAFSNQPYISFYCDLYSKLTASLLDKYVTLLRYESLDELGRKNYIMHLDEGIDKLNGEFSKKFIDESKILEEELNKYRADKHSVFDKAESIFDIFETKDFLARPKDYFCTYLDRLVTYKKIIDSEVKHDKTKTNLSNLKEKINMSLSGELFTLINSIDDILNSGYIKGKIKKKDLIPKFCMK